MFKTLRTIDYHKEQVETLLRAKAGSFAANFLAPILIAYVLKDYVPPSLLFVWLSLQIIVYATRLFISVHGLKIVRTNDKEKIKKVLKQYLFLIFISAFLLGLSGIFAFAYMSMGDNLVFIIIILTLITGSLSTLTPVYHAVVIFTTTILSMFIATLLLYELSEMQALLIVVLFSYLMIALPSSFKIYQSINDNIEQAQALKEKNVNFENLLDMIMEAVILSDENDMIIETNQAGVELLKFRDKSEAVGKHVSDYVAEHEVEKLRFSLSQEFDPPRLYDFKKNDGTIFPTLASGRDMVMNGEKVRISVILDLTQIKKQEQLLFAQSRLAQMGEMISMIAHQWRQPLAAIASTSANLEVKLELQTFDLQSQSGQEEMMSYFLTNLQNIDTYVETLTTTIDDFRNFYKQDKASVETTFETLIHKALHIIQTSLINDNVEIESFYDSQERLKLYDSEMMQVILNILKNAQDNFKERQTKNPKITIRTHQRGVTICDNGGGVAEEIVEKIFDPYFSTKSSKNGTGLGLYMSKTIVEEHHHGKLTLKNLDNGACFEIAV